MTDAWKALTVERFEHIAVGHSTALLRISAIPADDRKAGQRPTLRIGHGQAIDRCAPIPAPPDPHGILRAAYSIPVARLSAETKFWLEHGDGTLTALSTPTSGPRPDPATRAQPEPAPAESDQARRLAEAELERTRARLAELEGRLAELEIWRAELERSLTATTTQLADSDRIRAAQAAEIEQLVAELASLQAGEPSSRKSRGRRSS